MVRLSVYTSKASDMRRNKLGAWDAYLLVV
jgi:hypothetical protein